MLDLYAAAVSPWLQKQTYVAAEGDVVRSLVIDAVGSAPGG